MRRRSDGGNACNDTGLSMSVSYELTADDRVSLFNGVYMTGSGHRHGKIDAFGHDVRLIQYVRAS